MKTVTSTNSHSSGCLHVLAAERGRGGGGGGGAGGGRRRRKKKKKKKKTRASQNRGAEQQQRNVIRQIRPKPEEIETCMNVSEAPNFCYRTCYMPHVPALTCVSECLVQSMLTFSFLKLFCLTDDHDIRGHSCEGYISITKIKNIVL